MKREDRLFKWLGAGKRLRITFGILVNCRYNVKISDNFYVDPSMRYLALAVVLVLSGCGTMTVHQQEDGLKRLELTNVGIIAFPPEAAMGAQEVQMGFTSKAHQECPNGFEKVSERFIRPTAPKESAKMEWIIKCN